MESFDKVTKIVHFVKNTNLKAFWSKKNPEYYEQDYPVQEVSLVCKFGYNVEGDNVCEIKCPINPLPVKGVFQIPSPNAVVQFLTKNGWVRKGVLPKY